MIIKIDTEVIWKEIRHYNELAYRNSEIAQSLLRVVKELEGDSLDEAQK